MKTDKTKKLSKHFLQAAKKLDISTLQAFRNCRPVVFEDKKQKIMKKIIKEEVKYRY